jgi:hypothetical protein
MPNLIIPISPDYPEEVTIHYETYGTGSTKLLFIMGFMCTKEQWLYQIEYFRK